MNKNLRVLLALSLLLITAGQVSAQRQMEYLNRGLVAVRADSSSAFLSWRLLASDPADVTFNIYRKSGDLRVVKLNTSPLRDVTFFIDHQVSYAVRNSWHVKRVIKGKEGIAEGSTSLASGNPIRQYLSLPLQVPAGGSLDGKEYTYSANDASVADLDGDGEYEIILKWDPSNGRNPPQTGLTANQIIDAYKMDGTLLWRIDLGKNIRSGAAYTQFLVYDMDGDGKAEMICKTADGTIDGKGQVIGDRDKDWRTLSPASDPTYGKVVNGPEYITVFDGYSGAALATEKYIPNRYPLDGWGGIGGNGGNDNTGGRPDRFTASMAYLDGVHASAIFVRGWYGRSVLAAWDWSDGKLTSRWVFDSRDGKNPYSGMGNHSVSVADVDGDGKDEICIGAMTIDDDGKGLYTTGLRHGDALHLSDMDPSRPGLEVFGVHENEEKTLVLQTPGVALFDAANGKVLFSIGPGADVGRGVAADIDPTHLGFENWGGPGGLRDIKGKTISGKTPSSTNFVLWWDGDLTRELLDKNRIDKWDWKNETTVNLFTAEGVVSNNGTKATPALSADIFGDWREEVMWRTPDSKELRIYTTTIPTPYRFVTLMQDPQYRLAIAWQNVSYNQPPHPGFYLGAGMKVVPKQNIRVLPQSSSRELIYSSDFSRLDTSEWVIEKEAIDGSSVYVHQGSLFLDTKGGVTVWLNKKLSGNVEIEYTRKVVVDSGKNDRLSDVNQFWMAKDPANPNLFTRNGKFEEYDNLSLYYLGFGGNTNKTTRFRKYGNGKRALLNEYLDKEHLLLPDHEYKIKTVIQDGVTRVWVDGKLYVDFADPSPLKEGYFGFRSTWSRQEIKDLKIYQLLDRP